MKVYSNQLIQHYLRMLHMRQIKNKQSSKCIVWRRGCGDDRLSDLNDDINNDSKDDDFRGRDDLLDIASLLPGDSDGPWIQVNPDGKGGIEDKNFLSSGHHLGVDTVGSSLRDADRQIRSEPPNPQVQVSPWLQGTISPDPLRRPLGPIDDD